MICGSFLAHELWAARNKFRYNVESGIHFRFLKNACSICIDSHQNKVICRHYSPVTFSRLRVTFNIVIYLIFHSHRSSSLLQNTSNGNVP